VDLHTEFRVLSTCTGYGGIELGLRLAGLNVSTVCYIERESFAVANLVEKIEKGVMDDAPIWSDLTTFDGNPWRGKVDCITGGIPCQPFSIAGKRKGPKDERWLWPAMLRVIRDSEPRFVFVENVRGFISAGLPTVLYDLAEIGYDAEWDVFSASSVGAPHQRERVFILAYSIQQSRSSKHGKQCKKQTKEFIGMCKDLANSNNMRELQQEGGKSNKRGRPRDSSKEMANSNRTGRKEQCRSKSKQQEFETTEFSGWWEVEPPLGRVVDGFATRADELMLLGNGVVPECARVAWEVLSERIK